MLVGKMLRCIYLVSSVEVNPKELGIETSGEALRMVTVHSLGKSLDIVCHP